MGIRDRLSALKNAAISPVSVWLAGEGSPEVAQAGERVTVVVKVSGEDDGTIEGIDLRLHGEIAANEPVLIPLGAVPVEAGIHRVDVALPADLTASCHGAISWKFEAEVKRTKGVGNNAASMVDIAGTTAGLWWPEGARGGSEGEAAEITVEAPEVATVGSPVSGTVTVFARTAIAGKLEAGLAFERLGPTGKVKLTRGPTITLAEDLRLAPGERAELPYELELEPGVPPTFDTGHQHVAWQVRAGVKGAEGWRWIGVLDPEASGGSRDEADHSLMWYLVDLSNNPR